VERVKDAAQRLGYRPNRLAQSLRHQKSHSIGLISDDIASTPFAGAMIRGAQEAAWKAGHVLLLIDTEGEADVERAALETLQDRKVDGLVYARMYHQVLEPPHPTGNVPLVMLDARAPDNSVSSVVPDEPGGARSAIEHLIEAGHTRIGFVQTVDEVQAASERLAAFRTTLAEAGLAGGDAPIAYDSLLPGSIPRDVVSMLESPDRPTALFCFNDLTAHNAYKIARRLGLRIPEDLSVVGFDNQETVAPWLDPGLTTVQLPHYEMGRWAVEHLEQIIEGEADEPVQFRMPCPLVIRDSVSPPNGGNHEEETYEEEERR
jgi:LacI family transcriptional regulator